MTSGKVAELGSGIDTQDLMQILTNRNGYQANVLDRVICPSDTFLRFQARREGRSLVRDCSLLKTMNFRKDDISNRLAVLDWVHP
jgi:hypothetical protein